jgi:hypothetical protein
MVSIFTLIVSEQVSTLMLDIPCIKEFTYCPRVMAEDLNICGGIMILDKIQHIWQSMLGAALPFGIVK